MKRRPRILLTNDDGIEAAGLRHLAAALAKKYDLLVVAPADERSGTGPALTLRREVAYRRHPSPPGIEAYAVEGTPGDCVVFGLSRPGEPVSVVVSGINQGANRGHDVLISGTVGAALQAFFAGVPAMALSLATIEQPRWGPAVRVAQALVPALILRRPPVLLNVNLPNIPARRIKGVVTATMGQRSFHELVEDASGDEGRAAFRILRTRSEVEAPVGTDVWAVRQGYVAVTPLQVDLTAVTELPRLEELCGGLERKLWPKRPSPNGAKTLGASKEGG
ncbi:MAG: 5'/3'-nucleotidase SurE [Chloroflexi bacterium]|nr:5'/3'-nucleotidase SurE [Chloroflexota bacterium]